MNALGSSPTEVETHSIDPETLFVSAIQAIATHFERPTSDAILVAGLPLDFNNISVEDVEKIVTRIGLETTAIRPGSNLGSNTELPMLVLTGDFPPFVITEKLSENAFKIGGQSPFAEDRITFEQLASVKPTALLTFSKYYSNDAERKELGVASQIETKHWLRGTLAPFWSNYIYVAFAAMIINVIGLATPIFIMNVYDRILPNEAVSSLLVLAFGVIGALFFDYFLKLARSSIIDRTGRLADQKLSFLLFDKVLNTNLASRAAMTGEFTNRVSQYEFVREFFTSNTLSVIIDSVFVFIFLIVIYYLAGPIVIVPAIAFILSIIVGLVAQHRIGKLVARAANEASERNALLVESVSTLETIKSLRAEGVMMRKWMDLTKNSSKTSESIKQVSAGASSAAQLISQLVSVFVVIGGAYLFAAGDISTGGIIATVMLASRAIAPLGQITLTLARFRQAILSLRILDGIMQQPEDRPQSIGFVNRQVRTGSVAFQNMGFAYPETDTEVLSNFNLKIAAGERIGIIGKIGSGKTSLGKLISGLYQPTSGKLMIDGIDALQYHPQEIRKAVSFAGQNADLFSGTLKQNLLIAKPDATDEEIVAVAQKTGVDDFAARHPRGYDMPVGERGEKLSGGQKQAVAITRLMLANSKVVYLDEPTGAMDLASEKMLINTLSRSFGRETTVLIATHRYNLLELVDRLLVLDDGKVVADGPKEKVLAALQERARRSGPPTPNTR